MKKNSIDLFIYLLKNRGYLSDVDVAEVKAMHKDEIESTYDDAIMKGRHKDGVEYYKEKFGGDK